MNSKRKRVSDIITTAEISKWRLGDIVTVSAGCDTGKSYFIKNKLYDYLCSHYIQPNKKIAIFLHRLCTANQFRYEIEENGKDSRIDVFTYQKLESDPASIDFEKYAFIVCDEFHYFISDAVFNFHTDQSFYEIAGYTNAVRIFMSATGDEMEKVLKQLNPYKRSAVHQYSLTVDYSHINSLTFYTNDDSVETLLKKFIQSGDKAIVFMSNCTNAYQIHKKFLDNSLFLCSKSNTSFYKYVDVSKIDDMVKNQKFSKQILITTTCFDSGANLIDDQLTKIIVDVKDITSLKQCIGRKRIQNENDKLDVYIKTIDNRQLGGFLSKAKGELKKAEYLRSHSPKEYVTEYKKDSADENHIVFDCVDDTLGDNTGLITKKLNYLMYYKKIYDIELYEKMLSLGKYGYCRYLADYFGFYDNDVKAYNYDVLKENNVLENKLRELTKKPMYTRKDKNILISLLNVRSNGKLLKKRTSLNSALEESKLPFIITEHDIYVGKKRYQHTWKLNNINVDINL